MNLDDTPELATSSRDREMVAIDDALEVLAKVDPRKAEVVVLCFFGGLSVEETAEVVKISVQSVRRDWKTARALAGSRVGKVRPIWRSGHEC